MIVLKAGRIAVAADLAAERAANRRLLEIEIRGPEGAPGGAEGAAETPEAAFAAAAGRLGCEVAWSGRQRLKLVLPEGIAVADLYRLAGEADLQIRRLAFERTSLEDIFLHAMDSPAREVPRGRL